MDTELLEQVLTFLDTQGNTDTKIEFTSKAGKGITRRMHESFSFCQTQSVSNCFQEGTELLKAMGPIQDRQAFTSILKSLKDKMNQKVTADPNYELEQTYLDAFIKASPLDNKGKAKQFLQKPRMKLGALGQKRYGALHLLQKLRPFNNY